MMHFWENFDKMKPLHYAGIIIFITICIVLSILHNDNIPKETANLSPPVSSEGQNASLAKEVVPEPPQLPPELSILALSDVKTRQDPSFVSDVIYRLLSQNPDTDILLTPELHDRF